MQKPKTYICFDTNIYVFCALAARESMNPDFLSSIFDEMKSAGICLLVPEVIELELEKVIAREVEKACKELNDMKKIVEENEALGFGSKSSLVKTIQDNKEELRRLAREIHIEIVEQMHDENFSTVIGVAEGNILHDSIRLALKGSRPSKSANEYGVVQPDCLIVASIKHFMSLHPDTRIIFCSDNTHDFAHKDEDGDFRLHPDLREYFGSIDYYNEPKQLYKAVFSGKTKNEIDLEDFDSEYKRVSAASAASEARWFGEQFLQLREALSKSIKADDIAISVARTAQRASILQNFYAKKLSDEYANEIGNAAKNAILLFALQDDKEDGSCKADDQEPAKEENDQGSANIN